jgi:hypothetical protein
VRTVRREHMDLTLIHSPLHLHAIAGVFVAHDDEHRPHHGRHERPPKRRGHRASWCCRPRRDPDPPQEDPQRADQ